MTDTGTLHPKANKVEHVANQRTRVTEYRMAPGSESGFRVHKHDYVFVPVTAGRVRMEMGEGGASELDLEPGHAVFRRAGVAHNIINDGDTEVVFLEVELLEPAPGH